MKRGNDAVFMGKKAKRNNTAEKNRERLIIKEKRIAQRNEVKRGLKLIKKGNKNVEK